MVSVFSFYGIDMMMLALGTTILVQILKLTILRRVQKKILTFLPFVLGTILYGVYVGLVNHSVAYPLDHYVDVVERGFSIGTTATLAYVIYEQFVRGGSNLTATQAIVVNLLDGYVPKQQARKVAELIIKAVEKDVTGNGVQKTVEIITTHADEGITPQDVALLAKFIIETLARLSVQTKA